MQCDNDMVTGRIKTIHSHRRRPVVSDHRDPWRFGIYHVDRRDNVQARRHQFVTEPHLARSSAMMPPAGHIRLPDDFTSVIRTRQGPIPDDLIRTTFASTVPLLDASWPFPRISG